jgi:hypothetical protein|tara:strand:- start:46 stop:195 length:150 start_codon:yes stop_codon:yes gene_type:complete
MLAREILLEEAFQLRIGKRDLVEYLKKIKKVLDKPAILAYIIYIVYLGI